VEIDRRVTRRYEATDEDARLWQPGRGDLVRLRTWDIFERFLPRSGRVLDVGGGPGTHAAHLAAKGYEVTLVDPVPRPAELATKRASDRSTATFAVRLGTAGDLPAEDGSVDAVLLMGPLYHLVDRADRLAALDEAKRVLRPDGRIEGRRPSIERRPSRRRAQQPGVGPVGLGVTLAAPRRLRIGRLGHMCLEPSRRDLLDHVAPTSAPLHRQRHRLPVRLSDHVVSPPSG
jgi:SAM-dependent methyltransferase